MYWSNAMRSQYFKVWESYLTAALIYKSFGDNVVLRDISEDIQN